MSKHFRLPLLVRGFRVLGYVFMVLLIGLIGTLAVGFLDHEIRQWCWFTLVVFLAIGIPLGMVRPGPPDSTAQDQDLSAPMQPFTICLGWQTIYYVGGRPARISGCIEPRTIGKLQSGIILAIVGLVIGAGIGLVVVLVLASLALSPFTPESWRQSMQIGFMGITTGSFLPWIIIGISTAAGSILGMVSGVVLSSRGWVWKIWPE